MYAVGWGFAVIFFLLLEALTMGLTTIWFAAGAFVAAAVALFGCPFSVQIVAFVVVSVLCLVFTRPIAKRFLNDKTEKTNAETVCLLSNRKCAGNEPKSELAPDIGECRGTAESVKGFLRKPDTHVDLTLDMEDYYRIKDQEKTVK